MSMTHVPSVTLPDTPDMLVGLYGVEASALCLAYIYPEIIAWADHPVTVDEMVAILNQARTVYRTQYNHIGMNWRSATDAADRFVKGLAEILVSDPTFRKEVLGLLAEITANEEQ